MYYYIYSMAFAGKEKRRGINLIKKRVENFLIKNIDTSTEAVSVFDIDLNYVFTNEATCALLNKTKHELEGNNLLQLFPQLIASASHRHLLTAISGKTILDATSEGNITKAGAKFLTNYYPLKDKEGVYAVLAIIKKTYFP